MTYVPSSALLTELIDTIRRLELLSPFAHSFTSLYHNSLYLGSRVFSHITAALSILFPSHDRKQWSNLILELNLIRKAWKPYARIELKAHGIKKIIKHGTRRVE